MTKMPALNIDAATDLHNRQVRKVIELIVDEPIAAGATLSDVATLCESVLVGVVLGCFQLGSDIKALDIIVDRARERLAKIRLEDIETIGRG